MDECPKPVKLNKIEEFKLDNNNGCFYYWWTMITSKIWSVMRDIKHIYGFKFVLFGDFYQLPSVEAIYYDLVACHRRHFA